jgi:hypothetical protein
LDVHSVALEYVNDGGARPLAHVWNFKKLNAFQAFDRGRLHNSLVEAFKIINVAQLARLTDALAASESFMPVESKSIIYVVTKPTEKQKTYNCGACTSFP